MARTIPHTKYRNGVYHYNRRVPTSIMASPSLKIRFFEPGEHNNFFPGGVLCRGTLGTKDHSKALLHASIVNIEYERRVTHAKAVMPTYQTANKQISRAPMLVTEDMRKLYTARAFHAATWHFEALSKNAITKPGGKDALEHTIEQVEATPEWYVDEYFGGTPTAVIAETNKLLAEDGLLFQPDSTEFSTLAQSVHDGLKLALDRVQNILIGQSHIAPQSTALNRGQELVERGGNLTLRDVFSSYKKDTSPSHGWQHKCEVALAIFEQIFGEQAKLYSFTKHSASDLYTTLCKAPLNFVQRYPGKTIQQAIDTNENSPTPYTTISSNTVVDGYIAPIKRMFSYAVDKYYIDNNPFAGMKFRKKSKSRSSKRAFNSQELAQLFSQPVFTGCKSERKAFHQGSEGNLQIKNHIFWAPILALYTGARASELGGLKLTDVISEAEYPFIRIQKNEFRGMKSENARRDIPLPQELIDLGFIEYVKTIAPNKHSRLFPYWEVREKGTNKLGGLSNAKWLVNFNRYIGRLFPHEGAKSEITFHCFRKNYKQALRNMGVTANFIDEVLGHDKAAMDKIYANEQISTDITGPEISKLKYAFMHELKNRLKR